MQQSQLIVAGNLHDVATCTSHLSNTKTSQEHCTYQVTITLMTTLLPDRVTFIFRSSEIVTTSGNRIYSFSFPQESFHFRIVLLIC